MLYDVLLPPSRVGGMYQVYGYLANPQDSRACGVRRSPSFAYDNPIIGTDRRYFVDHDDACPAEAAPAPGRLSWLKFNSKRRRSKPGRP
ncbi:hypothetical protein [Pseudomonas sp. Irchel s3h17]|uniref:hypothetical protein n=1 Tax=Pseudomonas sp. Irchel s3h17 TaxID=2009182 RepID=UPI00117B2D7F|nr:hypothetical protein [Pseudomonas sp. Irchel s3h17]